MLSRLQLVSIFLHCYSIYILKVVIVVQRLKLAWFIMLCEALIGGVAFGLANPTLGCLADKYQLSKFSTFAIFIVSGKEFIII